MGKPRKLPEYLKFQYENLVPLELFLPQIVQYGLQDPKKSKSMNLAFDITPAKYVTGLITEKGICEASTEGLKKLFNK